MLPEFIKPELDSKEEPYVDIGYFIKKIIVYFLVIAITTATVSLVTYHLFKIISQTCEPDYLSIGASLVTFFSAVIAVLCLLDNMAMKKFDENVNILENKYTGKISGWNFIHRFSYSLAKDSVNHRLCSAKYKFYYKDQPDGFVRIVVPILHADFIDTQCIKGIIALKKIIPTYKQYIFKNQVIKGDARKEEKMQHIYYLILPEILLSLYKGILLMRILRFAIIVCNLLILSSVVMTVISSLGII